MFIKHKANRDVCMFVHSHMKYQGDLEVIVSYVNTTSAGPFLIGVEPEKHKIPGLRLCNWLIAKDCDSLEDLKSAEWIPYSEVMG